MIRPSGSPLYFSTGFHSLGSSLPNFLLSFHVVRGLGSGNCQRDHTRYILGSMDPETVSHEGWKSRVQADTSRLLSCDMSQWCVSTRHWRRR